ncbi:MAG: sodium:proton antiporter [Planctomycetota bacterium]
MAVREAILSLLGLLLLLGAAPLQAQAPVAGPVVAMAGPLQAAPTQAHERADGQPAPTAEADQEEGHAWRVPLWAVLPFVLMLLTIAVAPLVNEHWWENNRNRGLVSAVLGLPVVAFTLLDAPDPGHTIGHSLQEYLSFIFLLGSLFTISGGIVIRGNLIGRPSVNAGFLAVGGLLASFIGTTGAAMLLIRPLLKTNEERTHKLHTVIFFIFIVCNCGGCLTPLGDPPLFLGYLKGVPFEWTFGLWPEWLFVCGSLLGIYWVIDTLRYRKEPPRALSEDVAHERPLVVRGAHNFLFLGGVVAAVALSLPFGLREGVMALSTFLAFRSTRPDYRHQNEFSFGPILEVIVVFAGIFATMIPALALLNAEGANMGVATPSAFFWATGTLSSFLDNAPTYLSFLEMAAGIDHWSADLANQVLVFTKGHAHIEPVLTHAQAVQHVVQQGWPTDNTIYVIPVDILRAISLGAVFMGAMTYIGNGPNFMVRAIANEAGLKMPSFFGYMLWSVFILLPILVVHVLLFVA